MLLQPFPSNGDLPLLAKRASSIVKCSSMKLASLTSVLLGVCCLSLLPAVEAAYLSDPAGRGSDKTGLTPPVREQPPGPVPRTLIDAPQVSSKHEWQDREGNAYFRGAHWAMPELHPAAVRQLHADIGSKMPAYNQRYYDTKPSFYYPSGMRSWIDEQGAWPLVRNAYRHSEKLYKQERRAKRKEEKQQEKQQERKAAGSAQGESSGTSKAADAMKKLFSRPRMARR